MKKQNKIIIVLALALVLICGIATYAVIVSRANSLTVKEKKWIDESVQTSRVVNINVLNNVSVIGSDAKGVFFDFLNDFEKKYNINLNRVTFNEGSAVSGVSLGAKQTVNENDIIFYIDHYVLISKEHELISSAEDLTNKTVGVLGTDLAYVTKYIDNTNITFTGYDDIDSLINAMEENKYAIVPLHLYLDKILANNFSVIHHFSDINTYYVLSTVEGDIFSSVLRKYFNDWQENINKSYNTNLFNVMVSSMGVSETEIDAMQSVSYDYGFINNSPYEVIYSGNYGGIASLYLKNFTEFAGIEFNYEKYKNFNKLNKAISKEEVDLYFGYYDIASNFNKTSSGINVNYSIIANSKNNIVINSINSLISKEVYVEKNSLLYTYLNSIEGINVKTYSNAKELLKLNKKDVLIFIDSNVFKYYSKHGLENYSERYSGNTKLLYSFNVSTKSAMYNLLDRYINIMDANKILYEGLYNNERIVSSGNLLSLLARYVVYLVVIFALIAYLVIRKTKKITIAKKIKKEDKVKFIDQLTLLKNRNYLNENIEAWNKNTVYPQAVLIVDLNNVKQINDIKGYSEGDKQIQAAANVLIKTQLDNSDIIRTDGNEFVIYLVGYSQKQVTNYIHKLNKEFKKLPYNYGAEFGYSLIIDDIKTIEDALNEATKSVKEQKGNNEGKEKK